MTRSKRNNLNCNKFEHKEKNYKSIKINDKDIKEAVSIVSNLRVNFYQKIYILTNTKVETWKQFDFLSSDKKVENFIEKINNEIEKIESNEFNFEKYKEAILSILCIKSGKVFNDKIIKNMYIAKLQNIIFILQKPADDGKDKEKNENKTISM